MGNCTLNIAPPSDKCAVYADVDGTLSATNIVQPMLWFSKKCFPFPINILRVSKILLLCPYWLLLDKLSRHKSNISIYKQYRGIPSQQFFSIAEEYYKKNFKSKIFSTAVELLRKFNESGYRIVLVTGGINAIINPLANDLKAEQFSVTLENKDGKFTGKIAGPPLTGKTKADIIKRHAENNSINLQNSYALGDACGDLEMLECVGNPVAVNPDKKLLKIAKTRGWQILFLR